MKDYIQNIKKISQRFLGCSEILRISDIRKTINQKAQEYGNKIYSGLGNDLISEIVFDVGRKYKAIDIEKLGMDAMISPEVSKKLNIESKILGV